MPTCVEPSSEELNLIRFNKITTKALEKRSLSTQELRRLKANLISVHSKENGPITTAQLQIIEEQIFKKSQDFDENEPATHYNQNSIIDKMRVPGSITCQDQTGSVQNSIPASSDTVTRNSVHKKPPATRNSLRTGTAAGAGAALQQPYVFSDTTSADQISSLLHEQKTISSRELEHEQQTQQALIEEIAELTSILKESSSQLNKSVGLQNAVSSCVSSKPQHRKHWYITT